MAAQHRQALQRLLNVQPGMDEETKNKYLSGLDDLRAIVEREGTGTPEGAQAQARYDAVLNRLKATVRQLQAQQAQAQAQAQQQQQYQAQAQAQAQAQQAQQQAQEQAQAQQQSAPPQQQQQQQQNPANNGLVAMLTSTSKQNWIVPSGVPPQNAEQWRTDIQQKLTQVGQKMNQVRAQIVALQQAQQRAGVPPEQQKAIQAKIAEHTSQFNHFKEIINKFGQQQKMLAEQKMQLQAQLQQSQLRAAAGQQQQQQKPAEGMAAGGQAQANPAGSGQPQQVPQPAAHPPPAPMQRAPPPQPPQPPQQQRIATPVQRANSPTNPDARITMSPAPPPPPQQQQQPPHAPQQPAAPQQQPRPILQPVSQQQQQQTAAAAAAAAAVGRSPAPPSAATPTMPQPQSPAPRAGSVQPARPPTAAGTPGAQQPPQQQRLPMQAATSASTASPTTVAPNPAARTTSDMAQGHRLPVPKSLAVAAPQPIAMPPARPTLTGGMNSSGPQIMNTPAIIKQPAFEFDEAGMGLLSKRKLEELVKQIDPEERLDPDVEESILELVDEFIDNIATTACKMAKLRGSDTLDIKDIQIILERNWNIRIPGYAADEIRTVRKFNPAPGYHQKMAALAAQKQLNQTAGKGGD